MVSELRDERRAYLESTYNVKVTPDNKEVVKNCDIIILAVKPQNMDEVTGEIADLIVERLSVLCRAVCDCHLPSG